MILGTAAFADVDFLDDALGRARRARRRVGRRARRPRLDRRLDEQTARLRRDGAVIERLQRRGVRRFVYTDVDRDGMLDGLDLDEVAARRATPCAGAFIYSGGIGALADLRGAARPAPGPSLAGVIVGKALYERRFTRRRGQAR